MYDKYLCYTSDGNARPGAPTTLPAAPIHIYTIQSNTLHVDLPNIQDINVANVVNVDFTAGCM